MSDSALRVAPAVHYTGKVVPNSAENSPNAPTTIFTNLTTDPLNLYNALEGGYYVAGPTNGVISGSQWIGLPFKTKTAAVTAKSLQAAIGWISGTKQVKLSIYTDAGGVVGTRLGGGATTTIPDLGVCCALTVVNVPAGIALAASTNYWLVAESSAGGPDLLGAWQYTNFYNPGGNVSAGGWFTFSNLVPAAKITGTVP